MRANAIFLVAVVLATSACSQSPEAMAPAAAATVSAAPKPTLRLSDRGLDPGEGRVRLNARAGYFSSVDLRMDDEATFALVIDRTNLHEKWAPMQSVCVVNAADTQRACLTIMIRPATEPPQADLRISVRVDKEEAEQQLTHVPGNFLLGKEIRVKSRIKPGSVEFKVNGMAVMGKPLAFEGKSVKLGCSSAECIFTML
jgi:hypothetical protein